MCAVAVSWRLRFFCSPINVYGNMNVDEEAFVDGVTTTTNCLTE